MRIAIIMLLSMFLGGCESGHVVEITITAPSSAVSDSQLLDIFRRVAASLELTVGGATKGPGADVSYMAKPDKAVGKAGYYLALNFGETRSYLLRTLAPDAPKDWAERPAKALATTLQESGVSYSVRQN